MIIPLHQLLSARGQLVCQSEVARAYELYAMGQKIEAKERLVKIHLDAYYQTHSYKTYEVVLEICRNKKMTLPQKMSDVDPSVLRQAIEIRVGEYLERFDKLAEHGYGECSFIIYVKKYGDQFMLDSCGFNKCAAMLALGYDDIPNIVVTQHKKNDKVTVGACWDGSNYYPVEYINILYSAVQRNLTVPFDFVVYLGAFAHQNPQLNQISNEIRLIETGLPYWWCGMPFWAKDPVGIETETLLYLDLDVVIVGSLEDIINYPSDHCYMKDYPADICPAGKENDGNASVSLIRNGFGHRVWDEYVKAGKPQWNPLAPPANREFPLAAQGIMNDFHIKHDVFPESWVPSYKLSVAKRGLPRDCKVVSFHGRPKPHECAHIPFVWENWR